MSTDAIHAEEQAELGKTEPEKYEVIVDSKHRGHEFGDSFRTIGIATNMGAGGYTDEDAVLISDEVLDPIVFIDCCIHEGLHATFPQLSEREVHRAGRQIAEFIGIMFKLKGATLPTLSPLKSN